MTKKPSQVGYAKSSKEYLKIPFQNRKQMIRLVEQQRFSIKRASQKVNINYSTGKLMMKKYRQCGKITMFSYERHRSQQNYCLPRMNTSQNDKKIEKLVQKETDIILDSKKNDITWRWTWMTLSPINYHQQVPTYIFPIWGQNQTINNQQFYSFNLV